MSAQQISRAAPAGDDAQELLRLVRKLRRRLGLERLVQFALRGACGGLLLLALTRIVTWVLAIDGSTRVSIAVALAPFLAAIAYAAVRWPTMQRAARSADHRLGLAERLSTAIETLEQREPVMMRPGRLARLQVSDAVSFAAGLVHRWPPLHARVRRDALTAVAAGGLALAALMFLGPRDIVPTTEILGEDGLPIDSALLPDDSFSTASGSYDDLGDYNFQTDEFGSVDTGDVPTDPTAVITDEEGNLVRPLQLTPGQEQALDRLGEALGQVSAGRNVADSISQNDFQAAADQLTQLADELDQLSRAAKDQLAQALRDAANDPSTAGSRLGERERQAASALAGSDYDLQRRALQELARELSRTASGQSPVPGPANSASGDRRILDGQPSGAQIAQTDRNLNRGQGTSSTRGLESQSVQRGSGTGAGTGRGSDGPGSGLIDGTGEAGSEASSDEPGTGGERAASQGDPQAPSLDAAGEQVEVPAQLVPGGGLQPVESASDPVSRQDASSTTSGGGVSGPQETGAVAPEQNVVPGSSRDVVRDYFNGEQ